MSIQAEVIKLISNNIFNNVKYFPVIESSKVIAKYIASFANTDGGYIIFGVATVLKSLEVNGLAKDFYTNKVINNINKHFSSIPNYIVEEVPYLSKEILAIKVSRCQEVILIDNLKYIMDNNEVTKSRGEIVLDKSKVFIVHGHDNLAKVEAARFVESLGLTAIILHEQASSSSTIIEKIEAYSNVGFAIVLYSPCDLGKAKDEDKLVPRARQNVVFEHGYLMGKIGRKNVCALVKSELEKPNDISGVVYIDMDNAGAWKHSLFKEMKTVGYDIDANKLY